MLFVQGTRDRLADIDAVRDVVRRLGRRARIHVIADADHGFAVPARSGRSSESVVAEIADAVRTWIDSALRGARRSGTGRA